MSYLAETPTSLRTRRIAAGCCPASSPPRSKRRWCHHRSRYESLHFHELVHVIQWRLLGSEKFLALYADGLERFGYRKSPLEVMAFGLQHRFQREARAFSVEAAFQKLIGEIASNEVEMASPDRS